MKGVKRERADRNETCAIFLVSLARIPLDARSAGFIKVGQWRHSDNGDNDLIHLTRKFSNVLNLFVKLFNHPNTVSESEKIKISSKFSPASLTKVSLHWAATLAAHSSNLGILSEWGRAPSVGFSIILVGTT